MQGHQPGPTWFQRRRRGARAVVRLLATPGFLVLLGSFALAFVLAVIDMDLRYVHPGEDGRGLDTAEAAYAVFSLMFFGNAYPWPDDVVTQMLFFLVPILGLIVLGQGIARVGNAYLNRDRWERAVASTYKDHVIVCGLGRVGYRVIRWLLDLGEEVVVVQTVEDSEFVEHVRAWRVPVVIGDARRPEILEEAGIKTASTVAPITDDDLVNLAIATEARALRPDIRVVLRTFEERLAANLQTGFDIHVAYSTSALAAPAFAAAAAHAPVDHAFVYGEGDERALLTVTKFTVVPESRLVGYTMRRVEEEFDVAVIGHRTDRFHLHPPPDAVLNAGDGFVVSASIDALTRLARLTPPTRELRRYELGRWPLDTS